MAEPFLAEVRIFGFNFPPRGWSQCDGQILPINQNQSLYSLLGTTYGGDGRTTFALPDLRGRNAINVGRRDNSSSNPDRQQGQRSGQETVVLSTAEMPAHNHTLMAFSDNADTEEPEQSRLARAELATYVGAGTPVVAMRANSITGGGSGQGHDNMQPTIALNFCIAITGLFPSRN